MLTVTRVSGWSQPTAGSAWHFYPVPLTDARSACGRWAFEEGVDWGVLRGEPPTDDHACKACQRGVLAAVRRPLGRLERRAA